MKRRVCLWMMLLLSVRAAASVVDSLDFLEAFAWGDRQAALEMLTPNTEDFFHYHCLDAQLRGDREGVEQWFRQWESFNRNRTSPRMREMQRRQRLLDFPQDPESTWTFLRHDLGLTFHHRRRVEHQERRNPTRLDPQAVHFDAFLAEARQRQQHRVDAYALRGLEVASKHPLSAEDRRTLLGRLNRPDLPNLIELIVADLQFEGSRGFGHHEIHRRLTRAQLVELARHLPALLRDAAYVTERLARMPAPEIDFDHDHAEAAAHYAALWAFVHELGPMHNSLKASVCFRLLHHQRHLGRYDADLFRAYIELPRQVPYLPPERRERLQRREAHWVDFGFRPGRAVVLPPIGDEQALVREFLLTLLRDAPNPDAFAPYFEAQWLDALFAESKILHGVGRPAAWAARLSPARYREIMDRTELTFAPRNPTVFTPGEPVAIEVDVKRIDTLRVNLYAIQTFNYYTTRRAPLDQAVDLDGMTPTYSRTLETQAEPGRRVRHAIALPELTERGVYVVELLGGGVSSRALITLGRLEAIAQPTARGLVVVVLNERGETVREAELWMDGREFAADANGLILLPFSETPGERFVVLRDGDFSSPDRLTLPDEAYAFSAGIHLDPQNLPRRRRGQLRLRPDLRIHGIPLDPALLEAVEVTLVSIDARDTRTERRFPATFVRHQAWTRDFFVPDDLRRLEVEVTARLRRRADGERLTLTDAWALDVNTARAGDTLRQVFLQPTRDGWRLELRGLNGEPIGGASLHVSLAHPAFAFMRHFNLSTDAAGRVDLGPLTGLSRIEVRDPEGPSLSESLVDGHAVLPERIHLAVGETLSLPWPWTDAAELTPVSLWRVDRGAIQSDHAAALTIDGGELRVAALPPGAYDLTLHGPEARVRVVVGDGEVRHGFVLGTRQRLQQTPAQLPSVAGVEHDGAHLRVRLRNRTAATRVALRLARYSGPGADPAPDPGFPAPQVRQVPPPYTLYVSDRRLGDEYRYVLDRATQDVFAGSLLARPGLILNPWERRETTAEQERLKADEAYRRRQVALPAAAAAGPEVDARLRRVRRPPGIPPPPAHIGFDFLPEGAAWQVDLAPEADGSFALALDAGAEHTLVDIVVIDRFGLSRARYRLPDRDFTPRDVRLGAVLDPARAFSRQKTIRALTPGETATFPDLATTRYEVIGTVGQAFDLLRTLGDAPALDDFAFLKDWPTLDDDTKRARYGEFACHELHLFLYARDPDFFEAVVRPYLADKLDKTFVDRWLLDALSPEDTRLDRLARRNALELALLARRGGDAEAIRTALRERRELIPDDPEAFARQVRTALQAADLDATVAEARQKAREAAERESGRLFGEAADAVPSVRRRAEGIAMRAAAGEMHFDAMAAAAPAPPAEADVSLGLRDALLDAEAPELDVLMDDPFGLPEAPVLFQALPPTKEWAEQNYYKLPPADEPPERIGVNDFWRDVAAQRPLSAHLLQAHTGLSEILVALAFSGLPFTAEVPKETTEGTALTLTPTAPALLVSRQIRPAELSQDDRPLLLSQHFFRPDDRYRQEGNEQVEKFVTGEFVRRVVYGARVTLTNPTESRRRLNVLLQIPQGAIPLANGFSTDDRALSLDPYTTRTLEYAFYFPFAGEFAQAPAQAAADEALVGRTEPRTFRVVDAPTEVDREAWHWIAQHAEPSVVLETLRARNPGRLDLEEMAWRLRDREFFAAAWDVLADRLFWHETTGTYAIYHQDLERTRVVLSQSRLAGQVGPVLHAPLLTLEPVERKRYEHLEYDPLVNPRAHPVGERRRILNTALDAQYRALLHTLHYRAALEPAHRLAVAYYLLVQDRLGEGQTILATVDPETSPLRLQTDYLEAWLALRRLDLERAAALAARYPAHPVPRWRARFAALADALAEARGETAAGADEPDRRQRLETAAEQAPVLALELDAGKLQVTAHNLRQATLNLYPIDIELLFSRRPFPVAAAADFTVVTPVYSTPIDLPPEGETGTIELPGEWRRRNLVVEVTARGLRETLTWYAHDLRVRLMTDHGQIEVREASGNQPLPRTYVKVYARGVGGRVSFWKDGYTDVRGRFDYLSRNDRHPEEAARFAILVLHPEHGGLIREAAPPAR